MLNQNAWSDPPAGQFGTAASYYSDYRYQRQPQESASLSRLFRVKEGVNLEIRAEFTNIFNRLRVPNPTGANALATQVTDANGYTLSGFGTINTLSPAYRAAYRDSFGAAPVLISAWTLCKAYR